MRRAVIVVLVLLATLLASCGSPGPTPTPEGFRLEPVRPARADQLADARDQLQGRLDFVRPGVGVTVVDDGLFVAMPINEATPSFVDRLTARGEVWLVPIPPGAEIPAAGQSLDLRPLIRNDGFAEARLGQADDGRPTLLFELTPEAAAVFGAHSSAHVGEAIAIVVDGIVVSAPIIQSPILDGRVVIESGIGSDDLEWIVGVLRYGVLEIELTGGPYEPD